jgi:hypothetical protein
MYTWIPKKIEQAEATLSDMGIEMGFKLNPPASPVDIQRCEDELSLILPNSYKEFLKFTNGAHIFCGESTIESTEPWWTDTGLLIQSTSTICNFNLHHDQVYIDDENPKKNYIAFCHLGYICTGDFCGFDITSGIESEYKVLDCQHDYLFEDWQEEHVIADSFEDWLIKVFDEVTLNHNRPEYWIPSPL